MSAPRRWLETEEASAEAQELLRAGRSPPRMDDAVRGRSRRRVAGLAVLPVAAGALASWPQLALGALAGAVGTVAVMSVLTAVASRSVPTPITSAAPPTERPPALYRDRAPLPTRAPARVSDPSDRTSDAVPMPAQATAGSARSPVVGTRPAASESPPSAPPADGLQQEIQLLEEARRKLSSEPGQARRVLLEHEQRFAGGQLRIEREFLLIDALVRLGRRSEAESRARVLEGQAPTSLYGERLTQILGRSGSSKKPND